MKDLSKTFITEVESNISAFAVHKEDKDGDIAPIIDLKKALQ